MLKSGDIPAFQKMIARLQSEVKNIIRSIVEMAWFMRGGIQYHALLQTTPGEREVIKDFIEGRMEKIKKHTFPVY